MRHGTWQETGGGGSSLVGQIIAGVAVGAVVYGVFEAVSWFVASIGVIILVTVFVLAFLGIPLAAWTLVYRLRPGEPPWAALQRRFLPEPALRELPGAERPALPQHVHFHFDGTDPAAVAEILRRQAEQ